MWPSAASRCFISGRNKGLGLSDGGEMEAVKFMGLLGTDLQQGSTLFHCAVGPLISLCLSYFWSYVLVFGASLLFPCKYPYSYH